MSDPRTLVQFITEGYDPCDPEDRDLILQVGWLTPAERGSLTQGMRK